MKLNKETIYSINFNQSNLQDFVDCQKRFQLKYISKIQWPAPVSFPELEFEQQMERGKQFHQLIQQYFLGIPQENLVSQLKDPLLIKWWQSFSKYLVTLNIPAQTIVEQTFFFKLDNFNLVAKYDLLGISQNEAIIFEWKTSNKLPDIQNLKYRIQTRFYPMSLVLASNKHILIPSLKPKNIKMFYWYPEHPKNPIQLRYSDELFEKDRKYFMNLCHEIVDLSSLQSFPKTDDLKLCKFCNYKSFCQRQSDHEDNTSLDIDFYSDWKPLPEEIDQFGEIGF
ncbi:MAG: PD-(D/E)XK nuclease family protein [Anaerolineaceae bacterium]|nr:PD-(D/E)XK nuclease family protein [Anaerolineaceae bacterium]